MSSFIEEFKAFAMRGNVVDLAVGVVIGGAFGKIVTSMVADIIMPILSFLTGGINFTDYKIIIRAAVEEIPEIQKAIPAISLNWGNFLQSALDFLIIAFCIFLVIKGMAKLQKPADSVPVTPKGPSQEELLTQIRDLLKK
ncbi:large-conductance mechanosensitive channel protein MscL [Candidatus Gracilibacteria bacterium]|nr:large-conductance mechanosensitive channel protein MscL [Candidatus Gracilibacteria bacterium]